jgi:hypothetical protein
MEDQQDEIPSSDRMTAFVQPDDNRSASYAVGSAREDRPRPTNAQFSAAVAAPGLPQLQVANLGGGSCDFGDFFAPAMVGAIVAREGTGGQLIAAAAMFLVTQAFNQLFLVVDSLPGTVPPAVVMIALGVRRRLASGDGHAARGRLGSARMRIEAFGSGAAGTAETNAAPSACWRPAGLTRGSTRGLKPSMNVSCTTDSRKRAVSVTVGVSIGPL